MTPPRKKPLYLLPPALPECALCEEPTRRAVWDENGGLCTGCHAGVRKAAELLTRRPDNR